MDRVVARSGLSNRVKIAIGGAVLLLAAFLFYWFAPSANSQSIAADRLTISTVEKGRFDDFLPLRARVTPLLTVYLDAIEGGRVEKVLVEDGTIVRKGQPLAILSNAELQLNVLARQTEVSREVNSMRSLELALAQTRMQDERAVFSPASAAPRWRARPRRRTRGCNRASCANCASRPPRWGRAFPSPMAASTRSTCGRRSTASSPLSRSRLDSR